MDDLNALFSSLSNRMGMKAPLKFDAQGEMCLCVDDDLYLNLKCTEDQQTLYAYTELGPVPLKAPEELLKQMLQANLFGAGTGGATLAIDEPTQEVLLVRTLSVAGTNVDSLAQALEGLIQSSLSWRDKLMHGLRGPRERPTSPEPFWAMLNNA